MPITFRQKTNNELQLKSNKNFSVQLKLWLSSLVKYSLINIHSNNKFRIWRQNLQEGWETEIPLKALLGDVLVVDFDWDSVSYALGLKSSSRSSRRRPSNFVPTDGWVVLLSLENYKTLKIGKTENGKFRSEWTTLLIIYVNHFTCLLESCAWKSGELHILQC